MKYQRNQKHKTGYELGNYGHIIDKDRDWKEGEIFREVQKSKNKWRKR